MSKIKVGDHVAIVVKVIEPESDYKGMIVTTKSELDEGDEVYIAGHRILGKARFTQQAGWFVS